MVSRSGSRFGNDDFVDDGVDIMTIVFEEIECRVGIDEFTVNSNLPDAFFGQVDE